MAVHGCSLWERALIMRSGMIGWMESALICRPAGDVEQRLACSGSELVSVPEALPSVLRTQMARVVAEMVCVLYGS